MQATTPYVKIQLHYFYKQQTRPQINACLKTSNTSFQTGISIIPIICLKPSTAAFTGLLFTSLPNIP